MDPQRLRQFITSSTWDYTAVRRNVARWFAGHQPVQALVLDDTGFPKDGDASLCVARQYSGTLGKTANCQIGVSVHLVNEHASCAADWRLFRPGGLGWPGAGRSGGGGRGGPAPSAGRDPRSGAAPGEVAAGAGHDRGDGRPGRVGVLDLAGGARPVVAADIAYGDNALFRRQLTAAGWQYAVAVKGGTTAYDGDAVPRARPCGGLGQPPQPACPGPPVTARQVAIVHAEHDYRELKTGLGLDQFEGRSFTGWHRHVTLAVLAQAFCTLLRSDPKDDMHRPAGVVSGRAGGLAALARGDLLSSDASRLTA